MEVSDDNGYQLVQYGFSIFTYVNKYDQDWKQATNKLRLYLQLGRPTENTKMMKSISPSSSYTQAKVNYLPNESVFQVMSFLDSDDLCIVGKVCRTWYEMSSRDELWNNLLQKHFTISSSDIVFKSGRHTSKRKRISPKLIYKEMYQTFIGVLESMQGPKMKHASISAPAALFNFSTSI